MNCPVCDRSLAPTLSICPACGAMMNDTVREELQSKIMPGIAPRIEMRSEWQPISRPVMPPQVVAPPIKRQVTSDLVAPATSPTLVEFQTKSASVPDWRLQLQNAVQQRKGGQSAPVVSANNGQSFPTNGGAALKVEPAPVARPETSISDPRVANAMRRIAESRKTFAEPTAAVKKMPPAKTVSMRSFPFDVVPSNGRAATAAAPARIAPPIDALPKPRLVVPPPPVLKRDTNKLPPLVERIERVQMIGEPRVEIKEPIIAMAGSGRLPAEFAEINRIRIRAENAEIAEPDQTDIYDDDIDDLAPFSMRFGAGLFDMIIGIFVALLMLSPFAFTGASWSTASGIFTIAGTCAIVSFLYMTISVGFFGKTMGMRLFSLEIVDAMENEYPTLRQAMISSSIYLISLAFAGAGFITAFFNEERRTLHDLLSGTIVVREF